MGGMDATFDAHLAGGDAAAGLSAATALGRAQAPMLLAGPDR